MQLFLRYAEQSEWLPNAFFTRAYDARVLYILAGKGEMRFRDRTFPLEAGSFCYYPPGQSYWPCSSGEAPLRFVTLNFDFGRDFTHHTQPVFPEPEQRFEESKLMMTPEAVPDPAFTHYLVLQDMQLLREDFLRVVAAFHGSDPHRSRKAEALLAYILYQVLERPTEGENKVLRKAVSYIEENYSRIRSNGQLAEALHYHPYHLNRLFRQHLQCTLHRYILRTRLEKAAQMLQQTGLPVFEVARQVGFENADHFSKCFSEHYGVSPSCYRRCRQLV